MQAMVRKFWYVGQNGSMRPLMISLPMIEALVDDQRYFRERPVVPGSGFQVGRFSREKLTHALQVASGCAPPTTQQELGMPSPPMRAPRAPTLRALVRLAVKCASAEEMGQRLKRRFDRQQQRRGVYVRRAPSAADAAEIDRRLDRLLAQD
jgi:hypothetical protein